MLEAPAEASGTRPAGDEAAIQALHAAFEAQRAAFHADRYPNLEERQARVGKLMEMLLRHRERIRAALNEDFGSHPPGASDLIEVLGPVARAHTSWASSGSGCGRWRARPIPPCRARRRPTSRASPRA